MVVALTGTDLYRDLPDNEEARHSLEVATRLIVLQPLGAEQVPEHLRDTVRTIRQSVARVRDVESPREDRFEVCVLGHLRLVKDPFRAAEAARRLPVESKIRVVHIGAALEPEMEQGARAEQQANSRYTWLGELPRPDALRTLARSRLLVLSSLMEGGANAISEALVHDVPVISTRIAGSVGMLGEDYPGYFPVGDTEVLAALMRRAEAEGAFYDDLRERGRRLAPQYQPEREREAWRELLAELGFD